MNECLIDGLSHFDILRKNSPCKCFFFSNVSKKESTVLRRASKTQNKNFLRKATTKWMQNRYENHTFHGKSNRFGVVNFLSNKHFSLASQLN